MQTFTTDSECSIAVPVRLGSKRRQQKKKAKLVAQGKGTMSDYYDVYGQNVSHSAIVASEDSMMI